MFAVLLLACSSEEHVDNVQEQELNTELVERPTVHIRDLDDIIADGKLKVLITYSGSSYFLYRGQPMGYDHDQIQRFADHLGVELELHISTDIDSLFNELNNGDVDIVAHGMTITLDRKEDVAFSEYLYLTQQVLVQRKPENWRKMTLDNIRASIVQDPIELIGDTVSLRLNSSYFERLNNLSTEIGGQIVIDTLDGDLSTDEIIKMVADGDIKYTIADKNIANINASYYYILSTEVPVSFSQRIAWALDPSSVALLDTLNDWIRNEKKKVDHYVIYDKYFKNKRGFRKRIKSDFYSLNDNKISKYDGLIKENAQRLEWDWRLLAALIYQESQFNPKARSWAGASGLMQMMPATAKEMGVKSPTDPVDNLTGGAKYLAWLFGEFEMIPDTVQRVKFTMAAYNCGFYHVKDAQEFAALNGLDRNVWDENVDGMIVALSYPKNYNHEAVKYGYVRGTEPFNYVEQIFERYEHYAQLIELDQ